MHDLLRSAVHALSAFVLVAAWVCPVEAADLRAPSFDCEDASAPDEKAICDHYSIAWLDRQLDRAWQEAVQRAGAGGADALRKSQKSWLAGRRKCADSFECLQATYLTRLKQLSAAKRDGKTLTGAYAYKAEGGSGGSLSLVHHDDDTLAGGIETVSGPTAHLCNVHFEAAHRIGDAYLWTGPRDEADFNGRQCQVLIQPRDGHLRIDSLFCNYYCGARGRFDAVFKPL